MVSYAHKGTQGGLEVRDQLSYIGRPCVKGGRRREDGVKVSGKVLAYHVQGHKFNSQHQIHTHIDTYT